MSVGRRPAIEEQADSLTLRFKDPHLEALFDATWIREQRCYDVLVSLCEAVLSITFLMLGCLQRLVCSSNADVEQLAALGPLVSEFPCNGSSWLKMSHMVHHGYLFDMRFRYNLGDYSQWAWSIVTILLMVASLLLGRHWDRPLLRYFLTCTNQVVMLYANIAALLWSPHKDWLPATTAYLYSRQHKRFGPVYYLMKDLLLMKTPVKVFVWVGLLEWLLCLGIFALADWRFDGVITLDEHLVHGSFLLLYMCPYMWLHYSERKVRKALLEQHARQH